MAKTFEEPEEDQAVQDAWEARVPWIQFVQFAFMPGEGSQK